MTNLHTNLHHSFIVEMLQLVFCSQEANFNILCMVLVRESLESFLYENFGPISFLSGKSCPLQF